MLLHPIPLRWGDHSTLLFLKTSVARSEAGVNCIVNLLFQRYYLPQEMD